MTPARPARPLSLAAAACLVASGVAALHLTGAAPADATVRLVSAASAKCLQPPSGGSGGVAEQRRCDGSAAQTFTLHPDGDAYRLRTRDGACLTVLDGATGDRARVAPGPCHRGHDQRFRLRAVPGFASTVQLVAAHSGKCLDVLEGSPHDGAEVAQFACGDPASTGNQAWVVAPAAVPPRASAPPVVTARPAAPARTAAPTVVTAAASTPAPVPSTQPSSTPPSPSASPAPVWGSAQPSARAPRSRAYQLVLSGTAKGYVPRAGECSIAVHARYWTYGPDGKVYPTWHPPTGPDGCTFGHEHGDDPRTSVLFASVGWPAFGYVNEQLAPSNPASQRDEDHVGHKVSVAGPVDVHAGGTPENKGNPTAPVTMTCNALLKFHQGTHSPDALTNNLHELMYNARCRYTDDGAWVEAHLSVLAPLGRPGGFTAQQACSGVANKAVDGVGPASPADSPSGLVGRFIPDADCARGVLAGTQDVFSLNEVWVAGITGFSASPRLQVQAFPFFFVLNPSRYYDASATTKIKRPLDLCHAGAKGFLCDQVRRAAAGGTPMAYDDVRSPFNGAQRQFGAGILAVRNSGPTTWYTDAFGSRFTTTAFPGAIKQYLKGDHAGGREQGQIMDDFTNYAAKASDRIHAPN
ncbi:MAG: RICIN domain-containing protein [Kineosporiaceae bacterium]